METTGLEHGPELDERLQGQPAVLLVNTRSRSGREMYGRAHSALTRLGLRLLDVQPIQRPGRLVEAVRDAVRAEVPLVIVGGGDGSPSAAAHELADTRSALGVLPFGTANDFARTLGIPADLEAACEGLAEGAVARVDLGLSGRRHFLNAASLGLTSRVAGRLSRELKRRLGPLAYPLVAAAEAWRMEPFRLKLTENGRDALELLATQLVVGNGRFQGGGQLIAPRAALDDRLLDVYAVLAPASGGGKLDALLRWRSFAGLAAVGMKLRRGEHTKDPRVLHFRTQAVEVEADPPQELNLDGERTGRTPARFSVAPGALRVIVGRAAQSLDVASRREGR